MKKQFFQFLIRRFTVLFQAKQAATHMLVVWVYRVRTGPAETKLNYSVWFQSTVEWSPFVFNLFLFGLVTGRIE